MPTPGDGQVESYRRVVNGKVVEVNAYAKKSTSTTQAAIAARKLPGRPQMAAKPGSYASGRDLPGQQSVELPPPPPPPMPFGHQSPPSHQQPQA